MKIEEIKLEHNKKITALFSILYFLLFAGLCACIVLAGLNFYKVAEIVGFAGTIFIIVILSLVTILAFILFISQVAKFKHDYIFIADENGICDYSRYIVLKPIDYSEIESIEYKGFIGDEIDDVSEWRHIKIVLKDTKSYMKKLNILQKISFMFSFKHIELHLFSAKGKIKDIAQILKQNVELAKSQDADKL